MNKIIAHRGFSSRKLENTIDAFKLAFEKEYINIIEVDIRMTKDFKIICIHDGFIRDKFNLKSNIKDMNYDDLKKPITNKVNLAINIFKNFKNFKNVMTLIKYNNKKGNIPLLEEVLEMLPLNKEILIDIKINRDDLNLNAYEQKIIEVLDKYKNKNISIMSFNQEFIRNLKKRREKLRAGILLKKEIKNLNFEFDFYSIKYDVLDQDIVNKIIKEKKDIITWTINNYSDYLLLKKRITYNFDKIGITTDFPDLIYYLIKK